MVDPIGVHNIDSLPSRKFHQNSNRDPHLDETLCKLMECTHFFSLGWAMMSRVSFESWIGSVDRDTIERLTRQVARLEARLGQCDDSPVAKGRRRKAVRDLRAAEAMAREAELVIDSSKRYIELAGVVSQPPNPPPAFGVYCDLCIPSSPGVYFLWNHSLCVYVGKSVCLRNRLSCHERVSGETLISYIELPLHEIHLQELYYIWLLRPRLNSQVQETVRDSLHSGGTQ